LIWDLPITGDGPIGYLNRGLSVSKANFSVSCAHQCW